MRTFAACDVGRHRDVSLDAVTGGVVWEQPVADPTTGYYITMAPLTVDGKVMVGMSGGGYGIRGFVIALDVDTGREVWKTHTVAGAGHIGELQAWNLDTGEQAWSREFESHNVGPVLTTAGGLVFTGGTNDRYFRAFDAESGEELWRMRTNSGVIGIPTAFAVAKAGSTSPCSPAGGARAHQACKTASTGSAATYRTKSPDRRRDLGVRTEAVKRPYPVAVRYRFLEGEGLRLRVTAPRLTRWFSRADDGVGCTSGMLNPRIGKRNEFHRIRHSGPRPRLRVRGLSRLRVVSPAGDLARAKRTFGGVFARIERAVNNETANRLSASNEPRHDRHPRSRRRHRGLPVEPPPRRVGFARGHGASRRHHVDVLAKFLIDRERESKP